MSQPPIPPSKLCACGCFGQDHTIRWEGDTFKGTSCDQHGGHKFMPYPDPSSLIPHPSSLGSPQ